MRMFLNSIIIRSLHNNLSLGSILALMERPGFNINKHEPLFGDTPLLYAIRYNREDVALERIERGANVELANRYGYAPLAMACSYNLQATAHALVRAGADITSDTSGWNPLVIAAIEGHVEMVQKLLQWGADPSLVTHGWTSRSLAEHHGKLRVVQLLDTVGSILVVRSAAQVLRLSKQSALKSLPNDMVRMGGSMLV
jgi:hypothetical protein